MTKDEAIIRYGDDISFDILISYKDADATFTVNDDDPDLKPITITLPKPPLWHLIDGFGKSAEDQMFPFAKMPSRLTELYRNSTKVLEEGRSTLKSGTLTVQRVIDEVWDQLSSKQIEYEDEVDWIKKQIWHCHYGYWFFNNGKPTYLDGWHYRFLNYWDMTDANTEYRDRDRRWFLFQRYAYTCTEDDFGTDLGRRVCYGTVYPKHRRDGATYKSLCVGFDLMSKTIGSVIGGIQSFDDDNAREHYQGKLLPAFKAMPFFLKPMWKGSQAPQSELHFTRIDNKLGDELGCKINFATTAYRKFYDGKKLYYYQGEEEGKCLLENVQERWAVVKFCLAQNRNIHGFSIHPTTVEDMKSGGGENFEKLCKISNFWNRIKDTGQTESGLFVIFISGLDGMETFVDKYGMSIIHKPVGYQLEKTYIGAEDYYENEIDQYLKDGSMDAMEKMRNYRRRVPRYYMDCFSIIGGDTGFNIEKLDKALAKLKRKVAGNADNTTVRGNFKRVIKGKNPLSSKEFLESGYDRLKVESRIEWFPDPQGRWELSKVLSPSESNQKYRMDGQWYPQYPFKFTHSADPFGFLKGGEADKREDKAKLSKGGIATFWERDRMIDPEDKDISEWLTNRFVCTYYNRLGADDEFAEDALMQCEYFGGEMYPERNVPLINKHFIKRGYGGYLKYEIDELTRKKKEEPGFYSLPGMKQALFRAIQRYIDRHCDREMHYEFLAQCRLIKGIEYMTDYDLFTACGGALLGSEVVRFETNLIEIEEADEGDDIGKIIPMYNY